MGASAVEMSRKTLINRKLTRFERDCARLSSMQRRNADVTMKIGALGVTKQHMVTIELFICDHGTLKTAYAQKKITLKKHRNWPVKGLNNTRLNFINFRQHVLNVERKKLTCLLEGKARGPFGIDFRILIT